MPRCVQPLGPASEAFLLPVSASAGQGTGSDSSDGGGEQSTQVLRRGAAKTETKVLFKDERHKRRNFKQVSRFTIRFLGFF